MIAERGIRILTLEGGGARGLCEIQALRRLSTKIYDDPTGLQFFSQFDLIGGTSAGGVISLALANGSTLDKIEAMFTNFSTEIFPNKLTGPNLYDTSDYEQVLKDGLTDTVIGSDLTKNVFVMAADVTVSPWNSYLLRTYPAVSSDTQLDTNLLYLPDSQSLPLYTLARATTAVPTYFDPVITGGLTIIDGAVTHNNPTLVAIKEAQKKWPGRKIELIVELGTGRSDIIPDTTGMDDVLAALFNLVVNAQKTHVDTLIKINEFMPDTVYHRFSTPYEVASIVAIDETNLTTIQWMKDKTTYYMAQEPQRIATRRIKRVLNGKRA